MGLQILISAYETTQLEFVGKGTVRYNYPWSKRVKHVFSSITANTSVFNIDTKVHIIHPLKINPIRHHGGGGGGGGGRGNFRSLESKSI